MNTNHCKTETIFRELVSHQLRNIQTNKKLQLCDIKRISRRINTSIFDENICSIWNGYITNTNNTSKGMYVNFYFRKKKVALHRLLYCNFVEDLNDDEYLKFNCENKGRCCNIHHMNKFKYNNDCNVLSEMNVDTEIINDNTNNDCETYINIDDNDNTKNNIKDEIKITKTITNSTRKNKHNKESKLMFDDNDSNPFILKFD